MQRSKRSGMDIGLGVLQEREMVSRVLMHADSGGVVLLTFLIGNTIKWHVDGHGEYPLFLPAHRGGNPDFDQTISGHCLNSLTMRKR